MERQNLKAIEEQILAYVENISYDQSIDFMAFKIDMYRNIERFLSSDSVEYYTQNVKILRNVELKRKTKYPYFEYLTKLRKELADFINKMQPNENIKFEADKIDIIQNMIILLNPYEYSNNIQALNDEQHKKRLTPPRGWC